MPRGELHYHFDERILSPREDEIVRPVRTVPLHERRLLEFCDQRGIVCYLPLRRVLRLTKRTYKERQYQYTKELLAPMFPSYLFVRANAAQREALYRSGSVTAILAVDNPESFLEELKTVQRLEEIAKTEELEFNSGVKEGDRFVIENGIWQGVYGYLVRKERRCQWTVIIESIGGMARAFLDPAEFKMTKV